MRGGGYSHEPKAILGDLGNIDFYHNCVEFAPANIETVQDYLEYTGFPEIEAQDDETTVLYICRK